jgi:hypothetical protein
MSEHENWCDYPRGPCDCGYAIEVSKIQKPLVSQIQSLKSTVKSQDELIKKQAARIKELEEGVEIKIQCCCNCKEGDCADKYYNHRSHNTKCSEWKCHDWFVKQYEELKQDLEGR